MQWKLVKYRGRWCAARPTGSGTERVSLRLPADANREAGEAALKDFVEAQRRPAETVADMFERYLEDKSETATAVQRMRDAWLRIGPHIGHLRPDQVTRAWSREYRAIRRAAGVQDATIAREMVVARAAIRWHDRATPAVFELPPTAPPRERWLTRAEVDRLIEASDAAHIALAVRLMFATAARKEAILELTWSRVDLVRGTVDLRVDTGKRRKGRAVVPVGARTLEALRAAKAGALTEYVIEWAGAPVRSIRTGFDAACERAGLEDVSPHVLRHSAAVAMAAGGMSMAKIAQFLGHADSRVTERVYARFAPGHMADAAAILD